MRPIRRSLLLASCGAAIVPGLASAQDKTVVVLGTATPGGGFPVYGQAYAETLNATDPTLSIQPKNTKGSTDNLPQLEAGQLDLGQVTGEVFHEGLTGLRGAPMRSVRILNAMYPNSGMFIVRGDTPLRTIADLKGKTIAWGAKGSGFVVLARYVVEGLGLDMEKDFKAVYLDRAGDGPAMVLDGRADAMWGGGVGWPAFVAIANGPAGGRLIPPDAAELERIMARYPFLKPVTLSSGAYRGQEQDVRTVGSWAYVLARASLPDDVAYRLAKALHGSQPALGQRLAQARESTLANTVAAAASPDLIHPGVQRFIREAGLAR